MMRHAHRRTGLLSGAANFAPFHSQLSRPRNRCRRSAASKPTSGNTPPDQTTHQANTPPHRLRSKSIIRTRTHRRLLALRREQRSASGVQPSTRAAFPSSVDPASVSAAEWRTRAAGGTEHSWCRAVPGGTGTTLLALRLSRSGPAEAAVTTIQAALRSLQNAHPALRAHIRTSPAGPTLAFPSPAPPPPPLLPLAPLPAPDFDSLLEHELNRNPWVEAEPESSSSDAPVLFATLYELPPPPPAAAGAGGAALFVRIHTAACDRSAAAALARELVALLGGGVEDGERAPEEAAAEAGLEERIPQRDTWKPFWARGMDMVGYPINGLRTSTLPFHETGTERSTQMLRFELARDETTRLLDACKENEVRLCAAMAAATMLAARQSKQLENGQQETYSIATLINCRKFLEPPLDDHNVGLRFLLFCHHQHAHGSRRGRAVGAGQEVPRLVHQRQEQQEAPHRHQRPQLPHVPGHREPAADAGRRAPDGARLRVRGARGMRHGRPAEQGRCGGLPLLRHRARHRPVDRRVRLDQGRQAGLHVRVPFSPPLQEAGAGGL